MDLTKGLPIKTLQNLPPLGKAGEGFQTSSWSPDGKRLAGQAFKADGSNQEGVFVYSFESGQYEKVTDFGNSFTGSLGPAWLKDSRGLLFENKGQLFLVDRISKKSSQVYAPSPGQQVSWTKVCSDNQTIFFAPFVKRSGHLVNDNEMMRSSHCALSARRRSYKFLILIVLLICPSFAISAPQIKQFFPARSVLLGQPLFWMIELRYPLWESYRLQVQPCKGAEINVDEDKLDETDGEVRAVYRLRIVPQSLVVADTPSVLITDQKGQSTVITGKVVRVQSISGKSFEVKDPITANIFSFQKAPNTIRDIGIFAAVSMLTILLVWKFYYYETPRQGLRRKLKAMKESFRTDHQLDAAALCSVLRSELIWGHSVQSMSVDELKELAGDQNELGQIARSIESLEWIRYSNGPVRWDWRNIKTSMETAISLLRNRRKQGSGK